MQSRRLGSEEPEDRQFVFRRWADFDYLVVSLIRFRRACELSPQIPEIRSRMQAATAEFDRSLPALKLFRDVAEHFDEYAVDAGRRKDIERFSLEVSSLEDNGETPVWLDHRLNARQALTAAQSAFQVLQQCSESSSRDA